MKKELKLKSPKSDLVNLSEFRDNFGMTVGLSAISVCGLIITASIFSALNFGSIVFLAGTIPSLWMGIISGRFLDGRFARRKVMRIAKSRGIRLSRDEKRSLLNAMRTTSENVLMLGDQNIKVKAKTSCVTLMRNVTVDTNHKDEFNEAFRHALTINSDDLEVPFDESKSISMPNDTSLQKELNVCIDMLNENDTKYSSSNSMQSYKVLDEGETMEICFYESAVGKKYFDSLRESCETGIDDRLKSLYEQKENVQ